MAQFVEAGATDHQTLGGREGVELAGVEGGEDFLDVEGFEAVSQLLFFIGAEGSRWGRGPQAPRSLTL